MSSETAAGKTDADHDVMLLEGMEEREGQRGGGKAYPTVSHTLKGKPRQGSIGDRLDAYSQTTPTIPLNTVSTLLRPGFEFYIIITV